MWIASFMNSLVMVTIVFFMLNQPVVRSDERTLVKNTVKIKQLLFNNDILSNQYFLFLNVSHDKELIDLIGDVGVPIGNEVITDRKKIAILLGFLNSHSSAFKFVFCDVYFSGNSPNDSLLRSELLKLKDKVLIPYHLSDERPLFNAPRALTEFTAVGVTFIKIKLSQYDQGSGKTFNSMPLEMYEKLYNVKSGSNSLFFLLNGKPAFNNFIVNLRITKDDLDKRLCAYDNLGQFVKSNDTIKLGLIRDRIIVIGDFEDEKNDFHKTVAGKQPGALLLVNAYIALTRGDNIISVFLFPLLFSGFLLMSLLIFNPINIMEKWIEIIKTKIPLNILARYIVELISYATLLSILSFICFLLINIHVNVLYLAVYISVIEKLFKWTDRKFKWGFRVPMEKK